MIRSSDQKDSRKLPAMLRNKRWSVGRDTDVNVDSDKDVIQTQARGQEACIIKTVGILEIDHSFIFTTLNIEVTKLKIVVNKIVSLMTLTSPLKGKPLKFNCEKIENSRLLIVSLSCL